MFCGYSMRFLPLRGERQANLQEKNGKTSRFGRKSMPALQLFSLQKADRPILPPLHPAPFPAGGVFTDAACGGGNPMRKGMCCAMLYCAMLFYAMCTKVHFSCIYCPYLLHLGPYLLHLRPFLQQIPATQPGYFLMRNTVPVVFQCLWDGVSTPAGQRSNAKTVAFQRQVERAPRGGTDTKMSATAALQQWRTSLC